MRNRKDNDAVGFRAVDQRERKALQKDTASIEAGRRSGMRKRQRTRSRLLHCRDKTKTQTGFGFVVVNNFGK